MASYSDNTITCSNTYVDDAIALLKESAEKRFSNNQMKGNTYKCHLILNKKRDSKIYVGKSFINNTALKKNPGVKIDQHLSLVDHVNSLCK